jgi:hypothetical protein
LCSCATTRCVGFRWTCVYPLNLREGVCAPRQELRGTWQIHGWIMLSKINASCLLTGICNTKPQADMQSCIQNSQHVNQNARFHRAVNEPKLSNIMHAIHYTATPLLFQPPGPLHAYTHKPIATHTLMAMAQNVVS